jgi:hypothetical protein
VCHPNWVIVNLVVLGFELSWLLWHELECGVEI